jgi:hypothetical protein
MDTRLDDDLATLAASVDAGKDTHAICDSATDPE